MSRLLRTVLFLLLTALAGQAVAQTALRLSAPFDPGLLSRDELRTLQAALAVEGSYDALLDGAWGRGSQSALEDWVRTSSAGGTPTWRDVRALVRRFQAEHDVNGWTPVRHPDSRLSHLRPDRLLRQSADGDETRFVSEDGGLAIVTRRGGLRPTDLHEAFLADAAQGAQPYRVREEDRIITSARMRGGRHVYVRSDRELGIWITHILLSDEANRGRLGLIASSFRRGPMEDVDPANDPVLGTLIAETGLPLPEVASPAPSNDGGDPLEALLAGVLERALDELTEREAEPRQPAAAPPPPDRPAPPRAASGFYVNTTDIVTSADIATRCDGVRIAGGRDVSLLTVDRDRGIAIFEGPGPMRRFLPLSARGTEAGAEVTTASRRPQGSGLQTFGGQVVAARGADRDGGWIEHDLGAPRAGELGAPLLDRDGAVLAIWLDDRRAATRAPSAGALARAFQVAGVPFLSGTGGLDASDRAGEAVVSLVCAR
ncbi:S1 family peptidase [Jannaschia formosa]|uniref:S1 family peptidase n=1 Tax=Jannaschia formosa TaxID=2259592 RepID=UPI000E1BAAAC|nr:serine protease [Jannaschia formosa]TFL19396.1 serine protease [Jannaschia formosa]